MNDDGRYVSQYAVDHCVCAYCWGVLVQKYDDDDQIWIAVCAENENHVGYHHNAFKVSEINKHAFTYQDVKEFYRQTSFAHDFGLTPLLTGAALQDHAAKLKQMLGRDDSGLF